MQRLLCATGLIVGLLCACSTPPDPKDTSRELSAEALYTQSRDALKRGDTDSALLYLETLQVRFPQDDYALQAQLDIILANYQREDYDAAIAAAGQFRQLNPRSPHGAYATYMIGRSETARLKSLFDKQVPRDFADHDQRVLDAAFEAYNDVVRNYPDSAWAADAADRVVEIIEHNARHELKTARFYLDRGAFIGAANRAHALLSEYPDSAYTVDALVVLYRSYRAQGLVDQADDIRVLIASVEPSHRLARVDAS